MCGGFGLNYQGKARFLMTKKWTTQVVSVFHARKEKIIVIHQELSIYAERVEPTSSFLYSILSQVFLTFKLALSRLINKAHHDDIWMPLFTLSFKRLPIGSWLLATPFSFETPHIHLGRVTIIKNKDKASFVFLF